MANKPRPISPAEREAIVAALQSGNTSLRQVARDFGRDKNVILSIAKQEGVSVVEAARNRFEMNKALYEQRRLELRHKMLDQAERILERMAHGIDPDLPEDVDDPFAMAEYKVRKDEENRKALAEGKPTRKWADVKAEAGSYKDFAVALGILIDKIRLEEGKSTNNTAAAIMPNETKDKINEVLKDSEAKERNRNVVRFALVK